jgi:hypothetical protein
MPYHARRRRRRRRRHDMPICHADSESVTDLRKIGAVSLSICLPVYMSRCPSDSTWICLAWAASMSIGAPVNKNYGRARRFRSLTLPLEFKFTCFKGIVLHFKSPIHATLKTGDARGRKIRTESTPASPSPESPPLRSSAQRTPPTMQPRSNITLYHIQSILIILTNSYSEDMKVSLR